LVRALFLLKISSLLQGKEYIVMDLEHTIKKIFQDVMKDQKVELKSEITDETIIFETGLDSLGVAILVAKLNEQLGYDPFQLMEKAFYPETFKEFVDCYEEFKPSCKS